MTETRETTGGSTDTDEITPPGGSTAAEEEMVSDGSAEDRDQGAGAAAGTTGQPAAEPGTVAHDPSMNGEATDRLDGWQPDRPSYTRAPGMTPPPGQLDGADTATIPSVAVPATATLTGSGTAAQATFSASPTGLEQGVDPAVTAPGSPLRAVRVGEVRPRVTTPRGPRRARLTLKRVDPWSVMKFSFAVSLVLFIVIVVAAAVLYLALDAMGVFSSANQMIVDLFQSSGGDGDPFRITAKGVIGTAAVLGGLNVLLFTSLATLGAFIYNVCADLVGGVEVTLAERD